MFQATVAARTFLRMMMYTLSRHARGIGIRLWQLRSLLPEYNLSIWRGR
jgi:hypothetical protein